MNAPMQLLESLVRSNLIEHGGHPVLRWHNQGLQAENKNDFIRPVKKNSKNRVDGMVALIVAFGTYLFKLKEQEEQEKSIVKTQGVLKIQLRR
jgi:phage terminase large subunit-like protein